MNDVLGKLDGEGVVRVLARDRKACVDGVEQLRELRDGLFRVSDVFLDGREDELALDVLELKIRGPLITLRLDQSPRRSAAPIVRGQGVEHLTQALILDVIVDGLERGILPALAAAHCVSVASLSGSRHSLSQWITTTLVRVYAGLPDTMIIILQELCVSTSPEVADELSERGGLGAIPRVAEQVFLTPIVVARRHAEFESVS